MSENGAKGLSRFSMEIGVALLTGTFGAAVCYGSAEAGMGWTDMGPDAGYFPFYIGLLIMLGSAANLISAVIKHRGSGEIFFEAARFKVVLSFLLPLIAFAAVSTFLGLYVGTALYIAGAMTFQGRYKWWIGLPAGIAVSLLFFVIFEIGFKVPLLKGPVEAWFGIY
ncbi:tripartite tricarboxylate transporter TctB family protein [Pararhizobium sp. BT-229]|uniref:tripartite tricarboxylate transporter TctB family protein n=1 Tax=Pararhizobium sp. BT-229 TaxID=2986923 RepID=UPI0021F6B919|nr:tripartite tricarboxylate transporter TctB family protein [Pararhizobium sp. BT-229]MCV9967187.1 tripartite tricarboxylate transporter TctB family protein [Pararhizobium sp. BT-229]